MRTGLNQLRSKFREDRNPFHSLEYARKNCVHVAQVAVQIEGVFEGRAVQKHFDARVGYDTLAEFVSVSHAAMACSCTHL